MIEVSITEVCLFAWAMVATAFWHDSHNHYKENLKITMMLLREIAHNKVKVVETDEGFEFKEVK